MMQMKIRCVDYTGNNEPDINFVDGEYTLYITDSLNAKATKQIYVPIILTTNTINRAGGGEERGDGE